MTNKTRWTKVLLCAIVIGVVTLTAGGVVSLSAQGAPGTINSSFTQVLAELDQIIEMLAPNTPAAGAVTLSTGVVRHNQATNQVSCSLVNVGTTTIAQVLTHVVDDSGSVIAVSNQTSVEPGRSVGFTFGNAFSSSIRCRFSFVGFADDVRAALAIHDSNFQPLVALDAR